MGSVGNFALDPCGLPLGNVDQTVQEIAHGPRGPCFRPLRRNSASVELGCDGLAADEPCVIKRIDARSHLNCPPIGMLPQCPTCIMDAPSRARAGGVSN